MARRWTPGAVVAARCSWPNAQVTDYAAVFHARRTWDLCLRVALSAAGELMRQTGYPNLGTAAGRNLLGGHADLVFVTELGSHLGRCTLCLRRHADGGVPADILRDAVRRRPMWQVYRPVERELAARRGLAWELSAG